MPWWLIMIIVIVVALAIMFVLYRVGDKLQKKQSAQREQMVEAAQPMNMLIIDKKMLPMKDAGLPKMVMEQTPKRYQKAKLPIAKVKVGPQIMNMICDDAIFDELPTRGEVKAMVSGIYIISVKSVRGKKVAQEEETGKKKKGNWPLTVTIRRAGRWKIHLMRLYVYRARVSIRRLSNYSSSILMSSKRYITVYRISKNTKEKWSTCYV